MEIVKFNIDGVNIEMDKSELSKAIESGEVKLNSDQLIAKTEDTVIYSKDELETFKTNLADEEYKKGKVAGVEMTIKKGKEENGLDFEGKDFNKFTEALKSKILSEANIKPTARIQELETDLQKMQSNYSELQTEYDGFKTNITEKETRASKDNTLLSFIPDNGLKVDKDIALLALKNKLGIDVDYQDGNAIPTINGQVKKDDKTLQPLGFETIISDSLNSLNLMDKPGGGSGEGDSLGGKASDYDQFVKEMAAINKNEGSQEFGQELNKRISEGTLKI